MILFTSTRKFFVASYQHSHGLLLLRTQRLKESDTRIDVLFQDVRALELRMWFAGLTIAEEGFDFLKGKHTNPYEMLEPGLKVYSVKDSESIGFILGGIMRHCEDNRIGDEPSALIEPTLN